MKIIYIGYWPSGDGLTQAVIVPRLQILSQSDRVDEVFFCSVERDSTPSQFGIAKVSQLFYFSKGRSNLFLTKFHDFLGLIRLVGKVAKHHGVSLVLCNSPLAGIVGYHVQKKTNIPFIVECFEPHALYMKEVGVWPSWDLRYWILKYYEQKQKKQAFRLVTVSSLYSAKLVKEGVSAEKILTVPNCIPLDLFAFNDLIRTSKRSEWGIKIDDVVGIYVGKFGDIYYDDEAFDLFAEAFRYFKDKFWLVVLSGVQPDTVKQKLASLGVSTTQVLVEHVQRNQVPEFLSAADFAFSTIRPSSARIYCCPIKNGEYWANGLPILLEEGIGEDSAIVKDEGGGVILGADRQRAFEQISELMRVGRKSYSQGISAIAVKHRRMAILSDYYKRLFDQPLF